MIKVLYEDSDLLVVEKPAGLESQSSRRLEPDMVSEIKKYLSTKKSTRGKEPYVGVIHRLDKPVSGVMVYAKNQKAAASLSKQVQKKQMKKIYYAVTCGKPVDNVGNFVDYLLKDGKTNCSHVVDKENKEGKKAELSYRILDVREENALVEITLLTGRHHQIRVQFASRNVPLWGDNKYNPMWGGTAIEQEIEGEKKLGVIKRNAGLSLAAVRLSFFHPVTGHYMEFSTEPKGPGFELFFS